VGAQLFAAAVEWVGADSTAVVWAAEAFMAVGADSVVADMAAVAAVAR